MANTVSLHEGVPHVSGDENWREAVRLLIQAQNAFRIHAINPTPEYVRLDSQQWADRICDFLERAGGEP